MIIGNAPPFIWSKLVWSMLNARAAAVSIDQTKQFAAAGTELRGLLLAARAFCLLCFVILPSACKPPEPSQELNIDLGVILPEEWQAISTWESINIDADAEQEYLLFYRYDASTTADGEGIGGPIGAVIYDPQTSKGMPEDSEERHKATRRRATAVFAAAQLLARLRLWIRRAAATDRSPRLDGGPARREERN